MIVIAIIAVLAAILVPNFVRSRSQAQLTGCKENLKNMATAVELYSNEYGNYPDVGALHLLTPNLLTKIPTCPATGVDTYSTSYASVKTFYTICCGGTNHLGAAVNVANFPQYSSYSGLGMP